MRSRFKRVAVAAGLLSLAMAAPARAESIWLATIAGNDCSGLFGQGFNNCAIPAVFDPEMSPAIIKFNADGTVNDRNSTLFPTITGEEFTFTFSSSTTGSWTYTPGAGDPLTLVSFFVTKGGNDFNLFSVDSNGPNTWFTPGQGLSHLTMYEGASDLVTPEPATWLLVGSGLIVARRWRNSRKSGAA